MEFASAPADIFQTGFPAHLYVLVGFLGIVAVDATRGAHSYVLMGCPGNVAVDAFWSTHERTRIPRLIVLEAVYEIWSI